MPYINENGVPRYIGARGFQARLDVATPEQAEELRAYDRQVRQERRAIPVRPWVPTPANTDRAFQMRVEFERHLADVEAIRARQRAEAIQRADGIAIATDTAFTMEYTDQNWTKGPEMSTEAIPPLTFPLIAETDAEGVKKLYKTRYNELERKYASLHQQLVKADAAARFHKNAHESGGKKFTEMANKVNHLMQTTVDSEIVVKRMNQVIAELSLPVNPRNLTMGEKLDAFFGALLTRIRCEAHEDELAD